MTHLEAMAARRSVRRYTEEPIAAETLAALRDYIGRLNAESGLHIQLVTEEPEAFSGRMASYGHFSGVKNYFVLVGKKTKDLEERCGYYGERLVLEAQTLGLNTCWVALTYKKVPRAFEVLPGEKLTVVIAVGHGASGGAPRKSKTPEEVSNLTADSPAWFRRGVEAALTAPTAMNQQKFTFTLGENGEVAAKAGFGPYAKMDLGIVKYHFELGAGRKLP